MTEQKLANRIAQSSLIEFDLESAAPQLPSPPDEVIVLFADDIDLRAGDDDLDLLQLEEEDAFFSQQATMRGNREVSRFNRNW